MAAGIRALQPFLDAAITGINAVIRGINLIKPGADIAYVPKLDLSTSKLPTTSASQFVLPSVKTPTVTAPVVTAPAPTPTATRAAAAAAVSNVVVPMGAVGRGEYGDTYNNYINVSGAIDPESTARQIIDVLNQSVSRGGAGSNTALMA